MRRKAKENPEKPVEIIASNAIKVEKLKSMTEKLESYRM